MAFFKRRLKKLEQEFRTRQERVIVLLAGEPVNQAAIAECLMLNGVEANQRDLVVCIKDSAGHIVEPGQAKMLSAHMCV